MKSRKPVCSVILCGVSSYLPPVPERRIFKPAQLNALAKDLLESNFSQIWLEGEISNLSRPSSGHLYFTLKDERAQIRCAMFRSRAALLSAAPRDGQMVLVRARLTLYETRGDYQLAVESLQPAGQGALQLAFEALKKKLASEGLFEAERKKTLPAYIKRLALITSPRGAAIHDVLSVLARRFPLLPVELWPVPVQGADAAAAIDTALQAVLHSGRYDAVLITRGGGSLEDLWPFNDEVLVRRVAAAPLPVISAIGHEVDFSLLDFAADIRAPTPSAAAELLSPSGAELAVRLGNLRQKLSRSFDAQLQAKAQRVDLAQLRLQAQRPAQRLQIGRQNLQQLHGRLQRATHAMLTGKLQSLRGFAYRLDKHHPDAVLKQYALQVNGLRQRLHSSFSHQLQQRVLNLKKAGSSLNALSPLATLDRGYSILRNRELKVIQSRQQVTAGETLSAMLSDGQLTLEVKP
jgi:exodeoxyribonuclease VII large subunit